MASKKKQNKISSGQESINKASHLHLTFVARVLFINGFDEAADVQFFVLLQKTCVKSCQVTIFVIHAAKQGTY